MTFRLVRELAAGGVRVAVACRVLCVSAAGYYEFNFSPSLEWAAYHFSSYRDGMTPAHLSRAPGLRSRKTSDRLELTATVHLEGLPELAAAPVLRLALTAVVEDDSGRLSYWALRHARGNPDFHDPEGFALELHR